MILSCFKEIIRELLTLPQTRGKDLDSPETTFLRKEVIQKKAFLRHLYDEWYRMIEEALPHARGHVLELGSGGGFLAQHIPNTIASDVFCIPGLDVVLRGERLPFKDGALEAVVMTNVLHHLPDVEAFFRDATQAVRTGGRIVMIEPWNNPWARFIYRHLHHEDFEPEARGWEIRSDGGPLRNANAALPWILFSRDWKEFKLRFPHWELVELRPLMPVSYILSGGVSLRSFFPGWLYQTVRDAENLMLDTNNCMFAFVVLERTESFFRNQVR